MWLQIVISLLVIFLLNRIYLYSKWRKYAHIPGPPAQFISTENMFVQLSLFIPWLNVPRWLAAHQMSDFPLTTAPLFQKYNSPILKVGSMSHVGLIINDPEIIKTVGNQHKLWQKPIQEYEVLNFFGENIVSTEGDIWRKHRIACNAAFGEPSMITTVQVTSKKSKELFSGWSDGTIINAMDTTTLLTLSVISEAAFGKEVHLYKQSESYDTSKHQLSFQDCFKGVSENLVIRLVLPNFMYYVIPSLKKIDNYFKELNIYFKDIISTRSNKRDMTKRDILNILLTARENEEPKKALSDAEILADTYIFLFAGHETTAHTLAFSLHLLSVHPEIQEELHQQVISAIGMSDPTYEDLPKLECAFNVFKETLRLYPIAPLIPKMNEEATKLGDYHIPAKTKVEFHLYALHRNPKYWTDPDSFNPNRWKNTTDYALTNCFIPFSFGKRSCIGRRIAEIEATIFLAMLTQRYKFAYETQIDVKKEIQWKNLITITPDQPIKLVLKKRENMK